MSESVGSSEFLLGIEEYLRSIGKDDNADTVHTLARTINQEDKKIASVKAFMQDLGSQIQAENRELADLLHGTVKAENSNDSNKTLLHFLGKTISEPLLVDLIFGIIKAENIGATFKSLLHFTAKNEKDQLVADLIFGIIKAESSQSAFKPLLSYINNLTDDKVLSDLIHGSIKADSPQSAFKPLLSYINNLTDDKVLSDLIHGSIKSDDLINVYKAVLQYVGVTLQNNKIMSDMASAIRRAIDSEDFENEFVRVHLSTLDRQFLNDKIFRGINNLFKSNADRNAINDAFSRSQIKSKIWLIEELENVRQSLSNPVYKQVMVMAGWFGQIKSIYDARLTYRKMRIIELDRSACEVSDYIFNLAELENYKVKAVNADINNLTLHKNGYEWDVENFKENTKYGEKFLPDLIINTSAEHMTEEWFNQIRFKEMESNPIVAIQSNNLFEIPDHINCVHSVDHMKKKFPMKEILFEGELQLKGYKRVMLIGRP